MKLETLFLVLALLAAPACGGSEGPSLYASFVPDQPTPGPETVAMAQGPISNDVVTVNVNVTGADGIYGAAFEVVFDESTASYVGFTPGTAFEQGGNTPNYSVSSASTPGRVVVGVSRTGSTATTISGTKPIVGLQFRVGQPGIYPVTIQNQAMYDGQPTPQPMPGIDWFAGALKGE
jgi:hypothetical protein